MTKLAVTCTNKEWHIYGTDWDSIPHCEREFRTKMISYFITGNVIITIHVFLYFQQFVCQNV